MSDQPEATGDSAELLQLDVDISPEFESDVDLDLLESVLNRALVAHGIETPVEVSLVVTDDAELEELNRQYRCVEAPTDVLSFSQTEGSDDSPAFPTGDVRQLGDIVISGDRVRAQATEYGHSQPRELAYLAVHGLLHLLGHDHETPEEKQAMRSAEEAALEGVKR